MLHALMQAVLNRIRIQHNPKKHHTMRLAILGATLAFGLIVSNAVALSVTIVHASNRVPVQIPSGIEHSAPFDQTRSLMLPPGFAIWVFARVPQARFMTLAPNGDLLVSSPARGLLILLRPNGSVAATQFTFATGLTQPHDMAFHTIGNTTYLYLSESNRIVRASYRSGATTLGITEVVVDHLPDDSSPGVQGSYHHPLKNFTLHKGKLYVAIGSSCNACVVDTTAQPVRGSIYVYDENGHDPRLFASGVRNAEGLRFRPGTDELWAVVNNRDHITYPGQADFDGDGSNDFGKVLPDYVDGHPPDLILNVKDGGQYGWPFCNSNPDQGLDNMPYQPDAKLNPNGERFICSSADRPVKGIAAHSAPLGMSFLANSDLSGYQNALITALHGCWNCRAYNGHKIALYPISAAGQVGTEVDLVTGWVTDAVNKQRWGRPVDVIPDGEHGLYISDDFSGTIYQMRAIK